MLAVLQFIFSSFEVWLGTIILVLFLGVALTPLITIKHVRQDDD